MIVARAISDGAGTTALAALVRVELQRTGDLFSAYESGDGTTWTLVGTENIAMGSTVLVGLAVSSHSASAAARCTFDSVSIQ